MLSQEDQEALTRALAEKWEFHMVGYPHAKPYVETWRKGARWAVHTADAGETIWDALSKAVRAC